MLRDGRWTACKLRQGADGGTIRVRLPHETKSREDQMTRHLADHRAPAGPARLQQFLRVERAASETMWKALRRKPRERAEANRRAVEYARIERGRLA